MTSSLLTQLKIMFKGKEFKCAVCLALIYSCASFILALAEFFGVDASLIKDANQAVCFSRMSHLWSAFSYIHPFLVVLPFSTSYISDYKNQLLPVYFSRCSRTKYYISKLLACFIGGVLIIAVPFLINLILCNIFLPHNYNTWLGEYQLPNYYSQILGMRYLYDFAPEAHSEMMFFKIFLVSPLLYNIVYLMIFSAFSGLLAAFALSLSFWFKKYKIVLFIPLFAIFQLLDVCSIYMYSSAMERGALYSNYNIFDYIVPTFNTGQNFWFFGGIIFIMLFVIICSTVYGIKNDIKSIQ